MSEFWLAANCGKTEWYVMKGVEIKSGPHESARIALESLGLPQAEVERLLREATDADR